jgi:hypothetical protein
MSMKMKLTASAHFISYNTPSVRMRYAESLSDLRACPSPRSIKGAHLGNVSFTDSGTRMPFTITVQRLHEFSKLFTACLPTFTNHISNVISVCTKKQVIRVDAVAHIALMANNQIVRARAVMQFVREAMRPLALSINSKIAIAAFIGCSRPQPAGISLLHKLPECFNRIVSLPYALASAAAVNSFVNGGIVKCTGKRSAASATNEGDSGRMGMHVKPPMFDVPCHGLLPAAAWFIDASILSHSQQNSYKEVCCA